MQSKHLYKSVSSRLVALIDPSEHTMGEDEFGEYVKGKFSPAQRNLLRRACDEGIPIEVHGVYSGHVAEFQNQRGLRPLKTAPAKLRNKLFNKHRPSVVLVTDSSGQRRLHCYVFPSRDYVIQYADLVAHQLLLIVGIDRARELVRRYHYRNAEQDLPKWSGLLRGVQALTLQDDIVVLGEVGHIASELRRCGFVPGNLKTTDDGFHMFGLDQMFGLQLLVHATTRRRLWLVGCTECYWGEASALIAETFARNGAGHVIYAAKTANLIGTHKIHEIVIPSSFILFYEDDEDQFAGPLSLSEHTVPSLFRGLPVCSDFLTGIHLTMASVVRQTKSQARSYADRSPATLDAEIAYIARKIEAINRERIRSRPDAKEVQFTAIHYCTDFLYVRSKARAPKANLNFRGEPYRTIKTRVMRRISHMIGTFAMGHGAIEVRASRRTLSSAAARRRRSRSRSWLHIPSGHEA